MAKQSVTNQLSMGVLYTIADSIRDSRVCVNPAIKHQPVIKCGTQIRARAQADWNAAERSSTSNQLRNADQRENLGRFGCGRTQLNQ